MPIARALIDVNRPLERLGTPDGPVKTRTSYGAAIYKEPLTQEMQQHLVDKYWRVYHNAVHDALEDHAGEVKLFIDCHNMAQHGPSAYPDAGQARPLICIANLGDTQGEPRPDFEWTLCSAEFAQKAAEIAEELFGDMELLEPELGLTVPTVLLNSPFGGSYIAAHHLNPQRSQQMAESTGHQPPTAIMIEVNRGLLVGDQTAGTAITPPNAERIRIIRRKLYQWAVRLMDHV
jgi:N-formylglutamate amidohydrolase